MTKHSAPLARLPLAAAFSSQRASTYEGEAASQDARGVTLLHGALARFPTSAFFAATTHVLGHAAVSTNPDVTSGAERLSRP